MLFRSTLLTELVHRSAQMAVGRAEANNQQVGIVVAVDLEVGHLDIGNLLLTLGFLFLFLILSAGMLGCL